MQSFISGFDGVMDSVKAGISAAVSPLAELSDFFGNLIVGAILITIIFLSLLFFAAGKYGKDFSTDIKKPKTMATCAMIVAVNVVLSFFVPVFGDYLKIEFGFVTTPVVSMLFGPIIGGIVGMFQDIVGLIIKPTGGLLPTLTMTDGITGMIYGMMLYKKNISFARVFLTQLIIVAAVNICLNTIALAPIVASGLVGILPSRIVKNVILLPIQSVIMYALLKTVGLKKHS